MATPKTILIIDDDDDLREALAEQLALHEEFRHRPGRHRRRGRAQAREVRADLILLDVDLPDMDGREACRLMRKAGRLDPGHHADGGQTPTPTPSWASTPGANDYVTKPFRFAVLLARIRAHLRSHEQSEDAVFRIGPYEFRPAAKLLLDDKGKKIRLTEKETNILKYLYRAGDQAGVARGAADRGLGLQRRRHHPHAGNPHLSPAPEDRARSRPGAAAADRARRLPAAALTTGR